MDDSNSSFSGPRYMRSNYDVPSSIQIAQIHQLLERPRAELVNVENEISKLQSKLDSAQSQKSRLDETIHAYVQLLTPFRRLPDDILREIFMWCLPDTHNAVMDTRESPLLLGRVCHRWRTLAFTMPSLWTTLHISSPIPPPEQQSHSFTAWVPAETEVDLFADFERRLTLHFEAIRDWLNRSRSLPLSMSVELGTDISVPIYRHWRDTYYEILTSCAHRWKSLEVSIPAWGFDDLLTVIQTQHLPILEFLHIQFPRSRYPVPYLTDCTKNLIANAPKLHMLHLTRNPHLLSELRIDWTRITHLLLCNSGSNKPGRTKKVSLNEAFMMFSGCRRLQRCVLEISDGHITADSFRETSLPLLESLGIMDCATSLGTLMECLDTPSLRDITFYTRFAPSVTRRSPLISLLRRSGHHIESLTTFPRYYTLSDLLECLELVPSLKRLTSAYSWPGRTFPGQSRWNNTRMPFEDKWMKTILDFLLPGTVGDGCLCPKLQTIELARSLGLTDKDALNFLQQRLDANGTERLSSVSIAFEGFVTFDIHARLQRYVDEGLKMVITAPTPRISYQPQSSIVDPRYGLVNWGESLPVLWYY